MRSGCPRAKPSGPDGGAPPGEGPVLDPLLVAMRAQPRLDWAVAKLASSVRPTRLFVPSSKAPSQPAALARRGALAGPRGLCPRPRRDRGAGTEAPRLLLLDQIDADSLRPFGKAADAALLSLLDYPNAATQREARLLLAGLGSEKGLERIEREFSEAIAARRAPAEPTIAALVAGGWDPVPGLTDLALVAPAAVESLGQPGSSSVLADLVEKALRAEHVPERARAEALLLRRLCSSEADERLADIAAPTPIRASGRH